VLRNASPELHSGLVEEGNVAFRIRRSTALPRAVELQTTGRYFRWDRRPLRAALGRKAFYTALQVRQGMAPLLPAAW